MNIYNIVSTEGLEIASTTNKKTAQKLVDAYSVLKIKLEDKSNIDSLTNFRLVRVTFTWESKLIDCEEILGYEKLNRVLVGDSSTLFKLSEEGNLSLTFPVKHITLGKKVIITIAGRSLSLVKKELGIYLYAFHSSKKEFSYTVGEYKESLNTAEEKGQLERIAKNNRLEYFLDKIDNLLDKIISIFERFRPA